MHATAFNEKKGKQSLNFKNEIFIFEKDNDNKTKSFKLIFRFTLLKPFYFKQIFL